MSKVRVAIVGIGNCANSFIQGLNHYHDANPGDQLLGLVRPRVGKYCVRDIEVVAAFDVVKGKVGNNLDAAIWAFPNDTFKFAPTGQVYPGWVGPVVQRGPTLDGLGKYLMGWVEEHPGPSVNVAEALREAGADVVLNYLPVGAERAARHYAAAAIQAGCGFVNCMPVFLASDPDWADSFRKNKVPIIGDDIKSQVGATIVHRVLASLFHNRGVHLDRTYQLNIGGNGDFLNMLERERLESKKTSKTNAVISVAGHEMNSDDVHIGPSDYVKWLGDRKIAYIRLEGRGFGGAPLFAEVKLEVWDSPNSAGIVIDAVRCAKLAMDRGESGPIIEPSAYFMKSPPAQNDDDAAYDALEAYLKPRRGGEAYE